VKRRKKTREKNKKENRITNDQAAYHIVALVEAKVASVFPDLVKKYTSAIISNTHIAAITTMSQTGIGSSSFLAVPIPRLELYTPRVIWLSGTSSIFFGSLLATFFCGQSNKKKVNALVLEK
jgi:hypothetical protein